MPDYKNLKFCVFELAYHEKSPIINLVGDIFLCKFDIMNIPLLSELIEAYKRGDIKENGTCYTVYLTPEHKEKDSRGWIHDSEFKGYVNFSKKFKDFEHQLFWE